METVQTAVKPAKPPLFNKDMTLAEAYNKMAAQQIYSPHTPLMVFLMENPRSPIGLPGAIELQEHDYMHCILNQPLSVKGEAFVIGFTMGAHPNLKRWHTWLFKFAARYLYPRVFKFKEKHMAVYDHAVELGRQSRLKDFAEQDWSRYMHLKLADLRKLIGVDEIIAQS